MVKLLLWQNGKFLFDENQGAIERKLRSSLKTMVTLHIKSLHLRLGLWFESYEPI